MTEQPVDRRAIAAWRWAAAAASLAAMAGAAALLAVARLPPAPSAVLLLVLAVFLVAMTAWYPAARYRHLRYAVDGTGIMIRDGIFWRAQAALAKVRIQHTDVSQGPLQRHYGIATLKLYTAGSRFTKTELPGLAHATAIALRDELQREGGGDAV